MQLFANISFASFVVTLLCGVVALLQDVRNRTNRAFFALCLAVAYWALCEFQLRAAASPEIAYVWSRAFVMWPFVIALFAHFACIFSSSSTRRCSKAFLVLIYAPASTLSGLGIFTDLVQTPAVTVPWGYSYGLPEDLTVRLLSATWAVSTTAYGLWLVARHRRRAATLEARKRAGIVLVGLSVPVLLGSISEAALPLLGHRTPEMSAVSFATCCFIIGYGIWRHRLFQLTVERAAPGVVDAMPDALLVLTPAGEVASVNRAATRLFGYDEDRLLGMPVRALVPELAPSPLETITDREIEVVTRDGERVSTSIAWAPLLTSSGESDGHTMVLRDITDRRRAETQHLQERQFSDSIIDSLPGVFYLINTEGRFARWNRNMEQVTGYDHQELGELQATDLFSGDDKTHIAAQIAEVFEKGSTIAEAAFLTKEGASVPYFFTGRLVRLESTDYLVGMGVDVSEQKRLETELVQSQKMQAVGTLAGGIAHDFNNLLTVILGSAEIASATAPADQELREDLEQITIAATSAARLTRQLLQFSRKQVMQPKIVDLRKVVEPLGSMLQRLIGEDIHLELKLAQDLWPVAVDVASLEQVVVNLVVNARDAMQSGGQISLHATNCELPAKALSQAQSAPAGPYLRLSVEDNGTGIAAETQEHLFEPFYTTKAQGHGTGLGLSVVYGIVRQHDGWIQVTSAPGQGARFDLYLPRSSVAAHDQAKSPRSQQHPSLDGVRILLIEDESSVLRFTTAALRRRGCEVITAAGFEEGLATFDARATEIDLLFSDVILPDGNGLELARRVRASHPELPVLMTSGYTGERSRVDDILRMKLRFLQKPYKLADLYRQVSAALRERKTSSEANPSRQADLL